MDLKDQFTLHLEEQIYLYSTFCSDCVHFKCVTSDKSNIECAGETETVSERDKERDRVSKRERERQGERDSE